MDYPASKSDSKNTLKMGPPKKQSSCPTTMFQKLCCFFARLARHISVFNKKSPIFMISKYNSNFTSGYVPIACLCPSVKESIQGDSVSSESNFWNSQILSHKLRVVVCPTICLDQHAWTKISKACSCVIWYHGDEWQTFQLVTWKRKSPITYSTKPDLCHVFFSPLHPAKVIFHQPKQSTNFCGNLSINYPQLNTDASPTSKVANEVLSWCSQHIVGLHHLFVKKQQGWKIVGLTEKIGR